MTKIFFLIIIIFIIVILAVAAFFLVIKINQPQTDKISVRDNVSSEQESESQNPETSKTKPAISFDDQSIFTTFDSKLQIVYPSVWQQTADSKLVLGEQSDVIESVNFSSEAPENSIQTYIKVSQQYDVPVEEILKCEQGDGVLCEPVLIENEKFMIITKNENNSTLISAISVKNRKIYQLTFSVQNSSQQSSNIELVKNIIYSLKFF